MKQGLKVVVKLTLLTISLLLTQAALASKNKKISVELKEVPPITGLPIQGMHRFEQKFEEFLRTWHVPGAAIAVRDAQGEMIYARGFGWADIEKQRPVYPDSQFRIADVTKVFTAVAIMQLVEQGRLRLADKVVAVLNGLKPPPGAQVDPRIADITIRDLLQMTSGWDPSTNKVVDPDSSLQQRKIAEQLKVPVPTPCEARARFMFAQPLQHVPGTTYARADINYCILGLVLAKVTGQHYGPASYLRYLQEHILRPLRLEGVQIGKTLAKQRAPREVHYYSYPGEKFERSILVGHRNQLLPKPYGGEFYLPHLYASKGLLSSAVDLVNFAYGLENETLLQKATLDELLKRPDISDWRKQATFVAKGLRVYRNGSELAWSERGELPGSAAYMARHTDGTYWVVLFNSLPQDRNAFYREYKQLLESGVVRMVSLNKKKLIGSASEHV